MQTTTTPTQALKDALTDVLQCKENMRERHWWSIQEYEADADCAFLPNQVCIHLIFVDDGVSAGNGSKSFAIAPSDAVKVIRNASIDECASHFDRFDAVYEALMTAIYGEDWTDYLNEDSHGMTY